jgi:predicted MFS family arabinose efflux permease
MGNGKLNKWIGFIVLTIAAGLIYRVSYLRSVFYEPLAKGFNLTNTDIGKMMSVYSLTKTIIYIPGGILADRFDNRKLLVLSTLMLAALTFWYATIPSFTILLIIHFLFAFSNVIFWVSFIKAVRLFGSANEQGSMFGYSEGIRAVASLLVNFVALAILQQFISSAKPLSGVLVFYGIVYTVLAAAMWFLLPKGEIQEKMKVTSIKEYIGVLKHPSVWLVAFLVLCCYSAQVASEYTTPYMSRVLGMSVVMAGIIANIRNYGIGIFSAPVIGKIADKVGSYSKTVIALLTVEIVLALALLLLPGQPSVIIIAVILVLSFAVVMYALRGVYYATMGEAGVPYALTGTATGIISVIGYLPDAYMSMLLGGFLDRYPGAPGFKYVFGSIIIFAGLGIVISAIIYALNKRNQAKDLQQNAAA